MIKQESTRTAIADADHADRSSTKAERSGLRFARFMASPLGRWGRIGLGLMMVGVGPVAIGGYAGWAVSAAGILPLTLGTINGCILAPFLKVPFKGDELVPNAAPAASSNAGTNTGGARHARVN